MNRELRARAVLAELDALGLTVDDLVNARPGTPQRVAGPTVRGYLPLVVASYGPSTAATYRSYWRLLDRLHGPTAVAAVGYDDCASVVDAAEQRARAARGTDGRSARENAIAALRAFFERARRSGLVTVNPAAELTKPRRRPSRRRGLTDDELTAVLSAVLSAVVEVSRDPTFDLLLVRFHLESGARREGALELRLRDLDHTRATVWLHEKFGIDREQPVSPSLLPVLRALAAARGPTRPEDPVFRSNRRHAGAHPAMTRRHYNRLFERVQARLDFAPTPRSPPTCCATPPSPPSSAWPATPGPTLRRPRRHLRHRLLRQGRPRQDGRRRPATDRRGPPTGPAVGVVPPMASLLRSNPRRTGYPAKSCRNTGVNSGT